jgi:hypothetical protein
MRFDLDARVMAPEGMASPDKVLPQVPYTSVVGGGALRTARFKGTSPVQQKERGTPDRTVSDMANDSFKRRLKLLERERRGRSDASGRVPGSEAWVDFWEERILQIYEGKPAPPGSIPLAAWDAVVARATGGRK